MLLVCVCGGVLAGLGRVVFCSPGEPETSGCEVEYDYIECALVRWLLVLVAGSRLARPACVPPAAVYNCTVPGEGAACAPRLNRLGKFAFGDRTIPIHARTLGVSVPPQRMDVYYGTVQSAVVHTN